MNEHIFLCLKINIKPFTQEFLFWDFTLHKQLHQRDKMNCMLFTAGLLAYSS